MLDGVAIQGATNANYTANNFTNGDTVFCVVVSGGMCGGNSAFSNAVVMVVDNVGVVMNKLATTNIELLPNPAQNTLTVINAKGTDLTISDVLGKALYHARIASDQQQININDLANAVYLVRFVDAAGMVITMRLVKE